MKRIITAVIALSLAGCASSSFTNRISRTVACDQVLVSSMYGPLGITSKADPADAAALLKECKS